MSNLAQRSIAPILVYLLLLFCSCGEDSIEPIDTRVPSSEILRLMAENYVQLPEQLIAISSDSTVYAQYSDPSSIYTHGVMGDIVEGTSLVVYREGKFHKLLLESDYVFEDLRPRLVDVDQDGELEFICIRTQIENGAALVIYKIENEQLQEYAYVTEIGTNNRWLNYVAADDLDNDGIIELAWIQTPHIGGILKVARIERGALTVLSEASLYSNHGFGERNLCLSVLTDQGKNKRIYVPNQERNKIVGFSFSDDQLKVEEEIQINLDFSVPLKEQYSFDNISLGENNCIAP